MNEPAIEVWGVGTPRTLGVHWALHEMELAYECHEIRSRTPQMETASFLEVSPGRKIPVLRYGDFVLRESGAIIDYVFTIAGRAPADAVTAARIGQWSSFCAMELDATALYVMRRHLGLPEIYGEAPTALTAAKEYFERQIQVIAAELADGRAYLAGDTLSRADIVLTTCCGWAESYGLPLPETVRQYVASLTRRQAFTDAQAKNFPEQSAG